MSLFCLQLFICMHTMPDVPQCAAQPMLTTYLVRKSMFQYLYSVAFLSILFVSLQKQRWAKVLP